MATAAQQYADLWNQYRAAQTALGAVPAGSGPMGMNSPERTTAQRSAYQLAQQVAPLRQQIIESAPSAAPSGYHWGVAPDGSLMPIKNDSLIDQLGPFLALGLPAAGFGAAAALAPAAAGAGVGGAGTFGTAGMAGATGLGAAAPAVTGAGLGAASAAPALTGTGGAGAAGTAAGAAGVGGAGGFLGLGSLGSQLIPAGLGVASMIQSGSAQGKANALAQQAADLAKQDYQSRQPFRDMALTGLQQGLPQAPDLSSIFADAGNPYARSAPPTMRGGPMYVGAPNPTVPARPQMTPVSMTTQRPVLY